MTIGGRIHSRRKELRLTMKDIFNSEGIQTGNLSELEHDKYLPSVQTLISLSKVLNCSIDWILTGCEHEKKSLNSESLNSEHSLSCDGIPLNEAEMDLIAMYRFVDVPDKKTVFDIAKLKYEQATGEKISIYSTYSDTNKQQKSDSSSGKESAHEIA